MGTYPIIDAEKHFDFFHPEPNRILDDDRPYVMLIMDLGVRDPLLDRAKPTAKAKLPHTQHEGSGDIPPIKTEHSSHNQARNQKHPRYELHVSGCSHTLYNLITPAQLVKYKELLRMSEFLPEHTRQETISQAMRTKPVFVRGKDSYAWIRSGVLNPSTAGDDSTKTQDEDREYGEEGYAIVGRHPDSEDNAEEWYSDWDRISRLRSGPDVDIPLR